MRDSVNCLQNNTMDMSKEFRNLENTIFNVSNICCYDTKENSGELLWERMINKPRIAFNQVTVQYDRADSWEFPDEYPHDFQTNFQIKFINKNSFRLRINIENFNIAKHSLSLIKDLDNHYYDNWTNSINGENIIEYNEKDYTVRIIKNPFNVEILDKKGRIITKTFNQKDTTSLLNNEPTPISFARRMSDFKKILAFTLKLSQGEKIYGLGESFTRLNKRGQKFDLWSVDAHGCQGKHMYKPIPFYLSSNGYGLYIDTTAPITMDIGNTYDEANVMYIGDTSIDIYFFLGTPKEILSSYTDLTGKSPVPPLWSFGLWMSRITYDNEKQVREVAKKLRDEKIPTDVIHLDTGWFEDDWKCDYEFSKTRFNDPKKMIEDLNKEGFKVCLWQLPYFTPTNRYFNELVENDLIIKDGDFGLPTQDAIIDFSNEKAIKWYKEKIQSLIKLGVSSIKADFGEAAPLQGLYKSGKTGWFEHNAYPIRYNKTVYESIQEVSSEEDVVIWARSAWAGSQRYPIHWGGDAECTNSAMAASLRAGLSLGLCGFSYWSHDIGGFVQKSEKDLYLRWLGFGALTSHSRCHGQPPKEPWEFGESFSNSFRNTIGLKYRLMPYIYTEAIKCSKYGHPMLRTLFFDFPKDETSWFIEDQYMFGEKMMVAPLFEDNNYSRKLYIPEGKWIDYQTNKQYVGGSWYEISTNNLPVIILIREGCIIPEVELTQSTNTINWDNLKLNINYDNNEESILELALPNKKNVLMCVKKAYESDMILELKNKYNIKIVMAHENN